MDLTPGPAEDQKRSDEKPLGLLELIPDEAERGQLWRKVWEEYDAAYNEWRDNNPGWKAFYTAHHSYALDAALAVFGEALTSAAYRAGREDAAKAIEPALESARSYHYRAALTKAINLARGQQLQPEPWEVRAAATGGGPCGTCGKPFYTHICLSCSPDYQTPGKGCHNCRNTGMDQTPCAARGTANTERGSE